MKIINLDQGSNEWKALRRTKVGASDIARLMTGSEREIQELWEQKVLGKDAFVTSAMQRGTDMEDSARAWFSDYDGVEYTKSTALHDNDWLMASLDGYHEPTGKGIEIKIPVNMPSSVQGYGGYDKAYWQIQAQYEVYSLTESTLVIYSPEEQKWEKVPRNEQAIAELLAKGKWFYDCMMSLSPPFPDLEIPERKDKEWKEAAEAWKIAKAKLDEATELESICREGLAYLANNESARGAGIVATRYIRKGNVDYTKIPELKGVNLDLFRKPNSTGWRLVASS